jgi:MFS family permease
MQVSPAAVPRAPNPQRMTPRELRASVSLALLFAFRMLGLFLILPVFAVHARGLPGGDDALLVGLALGGYALTQGMLQIPFGIASDRFGRKPVIVFGLVLFALGSLVAALASDMSTAIAGRMLQGTGAISAAVTASIADHTRDSQRTKAMAMVGASIGLTFALSLVAAPVLYGLIGMGGIFALTGLLALFGIVVVWLAVPPLAPDAAPTVEVGQPPTRFVQVLLDGELMRLNAGVFALHLAQMAMFVVLPVWMVERLGLPLMEHWKLYLPVVVLSFALMMPPLTWGERHGRLRTVFLAAILLVLLVQVGYAVAPARVVPFALLLLVYFWAFNVLEASLPSLASRLAPADAKGAALGVYNTTQAFGLFAGGALGGLVFQHYGGAAVFLGCAVLMLAWLVVAAGARRWPRAASTAPAH